MSFRVPELPPFRGSFSVTPRHDAFQAPLSTPLGSSVWPSSQHQHNSSTSSVIPSSSFTTPRVRTHTMSNAPTPRKPHPSLLAVPNPNPSPNPNHGPTTPPSSSLPGSHTAHPSQVSPRSRTRSEPANLRHTTFGPWSVDFDSDLKASLERISPAEAQRKVMAARMAYDRVGLSQSRGGAMGGGEDERRIAMMRERVVQSRIKLEKQKQRREKEGGKEERKRPRVDSTSAGSAVSSSSSGHKRRKEQQPPETRPSKSFLQVPRDFSRKAMREIKDPKEWISRLADMVAEEWMKREGEGTGENAEQELVDCVVYVVESHQLETRMDGMVLLCEIIDELTRRGVMISSD